MTSSTSTFCILCILSLFATFHNAISTSTPAAALQQCASHPCENGGTCIEYPAAFQCRCTDGYTGLRCEVHESSTASVCDDNPCAHGYCVSSALDRFTCMCPGGWRGTACEIDVNECSGERGPIPCTNGTVCINEDGGYRCEAPCINPNPCANGGTCSTMNSEPYYTCDCPPNYEGDNCDVVVERDDPCRSVGNVCLNGGTCFSYGGAALCYCRLGFQGQHCEIDTDVCQTITCQNGGTCIKSRDQRASCVCPPLYSGSLCDISMLSPCDYLPCNASTTCIEDLTLDDGYVCMPPCVKEPCQNGGTCTNNHRVPLGFQCACAEDYEGLLCENMIAPCVKEPCQHGGTCTNNQSAPLGFHCVCTEDYQGPLCENMIPPCLKDPCLNGGLCKPNETSSNGYQCLCEQGFEGPICEVAIISPCTSNPCENGGSCETVGGALSEFSCICQQGYRGTLCEIVLHAVCTFEGVTYQDGSERKEDCNMCHCQQGSWHCTDKFCGEIMVSFAFLNTNSNENDDSEDFSKTLKEDIADYFDISVNMIQEFTVSGNPAEIKFHLQDTHDSEADIENVAANMLSKFFTGSYTFHYNHASYSINSQTVVIERRDSDNEANSLTHNGDGQQFISTTLLIVCVVVSTILVFAVLFGIAMIVVYKRRSRKEQIYCRKDKNTNASNNVAGSAIKYHKNVYNPVPPCPPARDVPLEVAEIRIPNGAGKPDVNINMEAIV